MGKCIEITYEGVQLSSVFLWKLISIGHQSGTAFLLAQFEFV